MSDYEEMSLEELKKLKEEREKLELVAALKAEDEARELAKKQEYEAKLRAEIEEKVRNELSITADPKLVQPTEVSRDVEKNEYVEYLKKVTKGELHTYESLGAETFNFTTSDDGCDVDVSSWSPEDVYVNAIWHTMYESANLFRVAVKGIDINKGDGMTVQIRAITRFSKDDITTTSSACECISCSSTSFKTYSITLKQHGISTEICEYDIWDVGEALRTEYLKSLGETWAEFFDWQIYNELETATPGYSSSIATADFSCDFSISGSCCTDSTLMNLYNAIDDVITDMRAAYYKPDYIIMHPTVARMFRAMQTPSPIFAATVEIGKDGALKSVLGVPVIEYNAANSCSDADSGDVAVIVVDSRRAVGAAFGQRPKLEKDRNIDCNSTTYAMWSFFGAAELDTNAIGHVVVA